MTDLTDYPEGFKKDMSRYQKGIQRAEDDYASTGELLNPYERGTIEFLGYDDQAYRILTREGESV